MHYTLVCVVFQHFHLLCRNLFDLTCSALHWRKTEIFGVAAAMEIRYFCSWKTFLTQLWRFLEIHCITNVSDRIDGYTMVLSRVNPSNTRCIRKGAWNVLKCLYRTRTIYQEHLSKDIMEYSRRIDIEVAEACSCQENRCFVFLKRGW